MDERDVAAQTTVLTDANEQHKVDLLEQFYLTLRVMHLAAPKVESSAVHDRIQKLFKDAPSWRNAYEIEQLLCFVLSDPQIEAELERRLAEAKALKLEYVDLIAKKSPETAIPPSSRRFVLHRLLNDLQWFYSKRDQRRAASKRLMWRSSWLFIVALVMLCLVLFVQFFAHAPSSSGNAQGAGPVANAGG
jgi:hypothetical protein